MIVNLCAEEASSERYTWNTSGGVLIILCCHTFLFAPPPPRCRSLFDDYYILLLGRTVLRRTADVEAQNEECVVIVSQ